MRDLSRVEVRVLLVDAGVHHVDAHVLVLTWTLHVKVPAERRHAAAEHQKTSQDDDSPPETQTAMSGRFQNLFFVGARSPGGVGFSFACFDTKAKIFLTTLASPSSSPRIRPTMESSSRKSKDLVPMHVHKIKIARKTCRTIVQGPPMSPCSLTLSLRARLRWR